ncbi:MAG TPA: hypothetical protein DIC60_07030 [Lachnospiraceae bacterium]|nr:hypothetical protein [Lachnospiraceae bacterium]
MKSKKKFMAISTASIIILATSITALGATGYTTPADALAKITGRTVESIVAEKNETGKTYGEIAVEAHKLNEFKLENLEGKKQALYKQVEVGIITQEKADAIIKELENNQANCDGTQSSSIGKMSGARFGSNGTGLGTGGASRGTGTGRYMNNNGSGGRCLQDGSCYNAE